MSLSHARRLSPLGVLGPLIFLVGVVLVSWSERDFMAELGWDQWPSGTALGPNGWATVLTFFLTGLCQIAFGWALLAQAATAARASSDRACSFSPGSGWPSSRSRPTRRAPTPPGTASCT